MSIGAFINGAYKEKDNGGWLKQQGVSDAVLDAGRARAVRNVLSTAPTSRPACNMSASPIYNVGGWYDIFEQGNIDNFVYLQNKGAAGARGNQKLAWARSGTDRFRAASPIPAATIFWPCWRAAIRRSAGSTTG